MQLRNKLWVNEISRDLRVRYVLDGHLTLKQSLGSLFTKRQNIIPSSQRSREATWFTWMKFPEQLAIVKWQTRWQLISCLRSFTGPHDDVIKWKHFPRYWPFVREIHRWPVVSHHIKANDAELWCFLWSATEQTVEQTIKTPVIWHAIARIIPSLQCMIPYRSVERNPV